MNRETKSLKTTRGTDVVFKAWISGKEFNSIQSVYLKSAKMSVIDGKPVIQDFSPNVEEDATNKLIEVMVVSVNGKNENLVNVVSDLPVDEYNEIVSALKDITDKKK